MNFGSELYVPPVGSGLNWQWKLGIISDNSKSGSGEVRYVSGLSIKLCLNL